MAGLRSFVDTVKYRIGNLHVHPAHQIACDDGVVISQYEIFRKLDQRLGRVITAAAAFEQEGAREKLAFHSPASA